MIDTNDLDRTLRAALEHAADGDPMPDDPAPRVARRVVHRRRRRVAARLGTVVVAAVLAIVGIAAVVGGSPTSTRPALPPAVPTTSAPLDPRSVPTPAVLRGRQSAAERTALAHAGRLISGSVDPTTIRLLQSRPHVRMYGARDRRGVFCIAVETDGFHNDRSWGSNCSDEREGARVIGIYAQRFVDQGTALGTELPGRSSAAFFVPDGITTVTIDGTPYVVTHNSVLVVRNQVFNLAFGKESRHGSTVTVNSY